LFWTYPIFPDERFWFLKTGHESLAMFVPVSPVDTIIDTIIGTIFWWGCPCFRS